MILKNYFPVSLHSDKPSLDELVDRLHFHSELFSYIAHIKSGRYSHTSPSFQTLVGYTVAELEEKGVGFFMEHVPKEDTLKIMEIEAKNFMEFHKPDFNPDLPNFGEFPARIRQPDGSYVSMIGFGTPLAYLPNGEFEFALVGAYPVPTDDANNLRLRKEATELLAKIKQLYRKIYVTKPFTSTIDSLTEIVFEVDPPHILTPKEKQVLKRIAQGLTTKQIAIDLSASENTIETHRRNMFVKFKVNNVAELITKTSKLYWLE